MTIVVEHLNHATHIEMKALVTVAAVVSWTGIASGHWLKQSTYVQVAVA